MFRKIFMFLVVAAFLLGIRSLSFAQDHPGHSHGTEKSREAAEPAEEAVNVGNKICPVSEERVDSEGMELVTYEYEGKIYNFCCPMCVDTFKNNPKKYIEKVEEELKAESEKESNHQGHEH